jgi:quercetin dioxygenase-like cupin family protein
MNSESSARIREFLEGFRWQDVVHRPYKEEGTAPYRAISRQVLFEEAELGCELRYFEMDAGGYSTLERHEHMHGVMILRGRGQCLLGSAVRTVEAFDLITIPEWTWHQFRANKGEPLGFLCMVNRTRDRPQLPGEADLAAIRQHPDVAAFLAG